MPGAHYRGCHKQAQEHSTAQPAVPPPLCRTVRRCALIVHQPYSANEPGAQRRAHPGASVQGPAQARPAHSPARGARGQGAECRRGVTAVRHSYPGCRVPNKSSKEQSPERAAGVAERCILASANSPLNTTLNPARQLCASGVQHGSLTATERVLPSRHAGSQSNTRPYVRTGFASGPNLRFSGGVHQHAFCGQEVERTTGEQTGPLHYVDMEHCRSCSPTCQHFVASPFQKQYGTRVSLSHCQFARCHCIIHSRGESPPE